MSTFEREWQRIAPYRWQGQKRTRLEADCRESPPLWVASSKERTASAVLLASVYELDACCSSLSSAAGLCFLLGAASATILRLETGARTCTEGCLVLNLSCASCSEPGLMTAIAPRYSSKGVAIPYSTQGGSALVSLASQKARALPESGVDEGGILGRIWPQSPGSRFGFAEIAYYYFVTTSTFRSSETSSCAPGAQIASFSRQGK